MRCITRGILLVVMIASLPLSSAFAGDGKLIATRTAEGFYDRWETGDYTHAVFRDRKGKEVSFFADPSIEKSLAVLKGKLLSITYEVRKMHIPEAGGVIAIEVLKSVKISK